MCFLFMDPSVPTLINTAMVGIVLEIAFPFLELSTDLAFKRAIVYLDFGIK